MKIALIILAVLVVLFAVGRIGLAIQPKPFPPIADQSGEIKTIPLPAGLPAPVERFYQTVYGDQIPVIDTVVITGRATMRPMMNIPLPARFVFVHNTGRDYRHYFEATWFGIPIMKVNEGIIDGESFFESPMGTIYNDPNTNQGANLALWGEGTWWPSIFLTDPRAHWAPIDDQSALLYVPYEDQEETFVVRFNPKTNLIDMMEAMRYRNPGDTEKVLWLPQTVNTGTTIEGSVLGNVGSAMWLNDGRPWAVFTLEQLVFNVDVKEYIRQKGY